MNIRRAAVSCAMVAAIVAVSVSAVRARDSRAEMVAAQRLTVLYQNFPNPFPTPSSATTCLWFDLGESSDVILAVHDLRGRLVRTIVPSPVVNGYLAAGEYGRMLPGVDAGCDARFAWDGRGSDGHSVPPGVYLARFHANGHWQTRKMVFRGP